jgi:uncharacterized sulfatase
MRRLIQVATLASEGEKALPELLEAMDHPDAAVRYWGATGVGNIGRATGRAEKQMQKALDDESVSVRVAAARALCRMGKPQKALPVLEAELAGEHQWGRLQAAIVLDEIDEMARLAEDALKEALSGQPNKYITRVANRALNELNGTNNRVR